MGVLLSHHFEIINIFLCIRNYVNNTKLGQGTFYNYWKHLKFKLIFIVFIFSKKKNNNNNSKWKAD